MVHFALKLLISFLVTNWVYSELVLFCPPLETFTDKVYATLKIPTHNRWQAIAESNGADRLASDLTRTFHQVGFNPFGVFNSDVKGLWGQVGEFSIPSVSNVLTTLKDKRIEVRDLKYEKLLPIEFTQDHYFSLES